MFQFEQDSTTPLYIQLADHIKHQIKTGSLMPGDLMTGENQLSDELHISRTTVRLAMNVLVDEGLIVRNRGKGSFVTQGKLRRNINYMYNFTENIRAAGAVPSSVVLRNEIVRPEAGLRKELKLSGKNQALFYLERLRCADGIPIIIEKTYIPHYLCQGIETINFTNVSLYELLQNVYSLELCRAVETIEAALIDGKGAKLLHCRGKMPGYNITRVSYLDTGYPFEYTTSITRADKCIFKLDLFNSRNSNKNSIAFDRQIKP
jgi:GntR family transcriptional regulator